MRPQLNPLILGPGAPWSLPGSSLDLQFTTGRAAVNRQKSSISSLLTTTRASTGYAATSSGLLVPFTANIPRITDLGLLVEQAATNLALQSAFGGATGTPWSLFGTTITTNAATAPDDTVTAALIKEDSSVAFHRIGTTTNIATAASTAYTLSLYAKTGPGSKRWLWINPNFSGGGSVSVTVDLTDGTTSGASGSPTVVTQVRGGFVYITVTFTTSVGTTSTDLRIGLNNAVGAAASYTGDGTSGNYVSSAQLELGSVPTSYIPTTTVSVTRAADSILLAGAALTAANNAVAIRAVTNQVASYTGRVLIRLVSYGGGAEARINASDQAELFSNGTTLDAAPGSGAYTGRVTAVYDFDASGLKVIANGGTPASSATSGAGTNSGSVQIGNNSGLNRALNGYVQRLSFASARVFDGLTT